MTGKVTGFGRTAQAPAGQDAGAADATIPTSISLDDPRKARGLDRLRSEWTSPPRGWTAR